MPKVTVAEAEFEPKSIVTSYLCSIPVSLHLLIPRLDQESRR